MKPAVAAGAAGEASVAVATLAGQTSTVRGVALSPEGGLLASLSLGELVVWEAAPAGTHVTPPL